MKRAELSDIPKIVEVASMMHKEGAYADVTFLPQMFARYLEIILAEDSAVCFMAMDKDDMVGGIIGHVCPHPFSPELKAVDLGFYVTPEYRGTATAVRLLRMYEQWALGKGVPAHRIYLGSSNGHPKTHAFFEKMKYNLVGGLYQRQQEM